MRAFVERFLGPTTSTVLVSFFVLCLLTFVLFLAERGDPVTKYYSYYGNVTSRVVFNYPERIHSFTFGEAPKEPLKLSFVNSLWCTPVSAPTQAPSLIATREGTVGSFKFKNTLPESMIHSAILEGQSFSRLGIFDEQLIRKMDAQENYSTWTMGNHHPRESSICYLVSEVTGYTTVLNLPKTIVFKSSQFFYRVPAGVYDEDGNMLLSPNHPMHQDFNGRQ